MNNSEKYNQQPESESDEHDNQQGDLEIKHYLGGGSFGVTYLAILHNPSAFPKAQGARNVAVKVPRNDEAETALRLELDHNAILVVRRSDNLNNIVRYFGAASYENRVSMVMEYLPDGSLRDRMHRRPSLRVDEILSISLDVLRGLRVLHSEEITHRDIKPENILMQADTAKIGDLGISRTHMRAVGTKIGSLPYLAPEVLRGHQYGQNVDLWSLGVIMFEMLARVRPFVHDNDIELAKLIADPDIPPPPLREKSPHLPTALCDVVDTALQKNPAKRFPTASAMYQAVEEAIDPNLGLQAAIDKIENSIKKRRGFDDLRQSIGNLVDKFPDRSETYRKATDYYLRIGQTDVAINVARRGAERFPDNAQLHYSCGVALDQANLSTEAAKAMKAAKERGLTGVEADLADAVIAKA